MRANGWVMLGVIALCQAADAGAPSPTSAPSPHPCTAVELKSARGAAQKLFDKKDYAGAQARLEALSKVCYPDTGSEDQPNLDAFWYASDLAVAALKNGDPVECLRVLAAVTDPHDAVTHAIEDSKVGKALAFNQDQCAKAHEAARRDFTAGPCPTGGHDGAIGIDGGCLAVQGGAGYEQFKKALDEDHVEDAEALCPHVMSIVKGKDTRLHATGGPLVATSNCCGVDKLSFSRKDGKRRVRVESAYPARDCFGGSATTAIDAVYEWKGAELKLVSDDSIGLH